MRFVCRRPVAASTGSAQRGSLAVLVIAWLAVASGAIADDRFTLVLEGGPVWQLRNDFAVPGGTGTLVRLEDDTSTAGRATLLWEATPRWSVRIVAAPLGIEGSVTSTAPVSFAGVNFAPNTALETEYRFDSWRAGAVYHFRERGPLALRAGLTLKVRDAEISLRNGQQSATKSNTGLVPLLHAGARWNLGERLSVDVDLDGAAAPQGRAIDLSVHASYRVSSSVSWLAGARVLDGGADNDEVYTFATFAYGFAGVSVRF